MLRLALLFAAWAIAAGLTACSWIQNDPEEVRACRAFVQAGLRSPSTYREIKLTSGDLPITEAELRARYFADARDEVDRVNMAMVHGHRLALRTVILEHDAANAYGTPIRGMGGCAFLMIDGQLQDSGNLEARARAAAATAQLESLTEQLGDNELRRQARRHGDGTGLPCCMR